MDKKPFCLKPFQHFHSGNSGYIKACCVANINYGNINTQSLDEIWSGKSIKDLRNKFLKGESDPRCAVCLSAEEGGVKSIRQETFEKFPNFSISENTLPTTFDIRFSNICNFTCRTCWHGASSSWFEESKRLGNSASDKAIIQNIKDFNQFILKMEPALLNAEEIYFAGGEPLITEEHYLLLDWLIQNKATNLHLIYNTNLSNISYKNWNLKELWKHFSKVEILASVDATHELGNYIRKGFDWDKFVQNALSIKQLDNLHLKIAPTISVFNLEHIADLYKTCLKLNLINDFDFYLNILERPFHYNIKLFSKEKKQAISQYLESQNLPIQSQINQCISYMNSGDLKEKHKTKFKEETALLDEWRKESFPINLD